MSHPHITLFTIAFNAEKTIRTTIESILANAKPGPNFTYIIQDGASTDTTLAIAKEYEKQGVIIRSEKDKGAYDAIDKAIASVANPNSYIGFIHADDTLAPGTLQRIYTLIKANPQADIVSMGCALQTESGHILNSFTGKRLTPSVANCFEVSALPNTRLITKRLYSKIGPNQWQREGFPYFISADLDFMLRAIISRPVMVQSNQVGYIYLFHSGSTTLNGTEKASRTAWKEERHLLTEYLSNPEKYPFNVYEKLILRRQWLLNGLKQARMDKSLRPLRHAFGQSGIGYLPLTLPLVGGFFINKATAIILRRCGR